MYGYWPKILSVVLSVLMTGALGFCACGTGACMHGGSAAVQEAEKPSACSSCQGAKQAPEDNQKPAGHEGGECEGCKPLAKVEPFQLQKPHAPQLNPLATATLALPVLARPIGFVLTVGNTREDIPIPPLLRDLFHSSVLLTI